MNATYAVESLLPHRYPVLLVDRVLDLVPGESVTAVKAVTRNEPFYRKAGTAPESGPEYPQALLIESWGQTAGILATWHRDSEQAAAGGEPVAADPVMLLGGVTGVTFHRPVLPGDVLHHSARVSRMLSDTVIFEGETRCDGEVVMSVERVVMAFRPAEQLQPSTGPARPVEEENVR